MAKKKVKSKTKAATKPPAAPAAEKVKSEAITATISTTTPPVLLKVCRLCESIDGPFLNIFDADKITAKKIEELMPFGIAENDDLPHKICFRCSAKLEELYEFIQKCIRTQENLRKALGKDGPFITKTKHIKAWEEKLNKSNISNDDICDALIKKAMAGIKNIPLNDIPLDDPPVQPSNKRASRKSEPEATKKDIIRVLKSEEINEKELKNTQTTPRIDEEKVLPTRSSRLRNATPNITPKRTQTPTLETTEKKPEINKIPEETKPKVQNMQTFSLDYDVDKKPPVAEEKKVETVKPFNIMDYISTIKVNGVGVLFQCKLCNRNFLKMDVVESHTCAKNGAPKTDIPKALPVREPPKIPNTVKYIKMEGDSLKKTISERAHKIENSSLSNVSNTIQHDSVWKSFSNSPAKAGPSDDANKLSNDEATKNYTKHKAGPASKTKRIPPKTDSETNYKANNTPNSGNNLSLLRNTLTPSVHFPNTPNLNGRYKLVPGPNSTFTLVEDTSAQPSANIIQLDESDDKPSKKRKLDEIIALETKNKERKINTAKNKVYDVIDLDDNHTSNSQTSQPSQPYPVGLFQTVAHAARFEPSTHFTTPAMKKQSYTIVQTGNPSKLLISTKANVEAVVEVPKKRQKKSKGEVKEDSQPKEPFNVTLEDVEQPKDAGFFTFINVDPLLQPSYVLPTDNIIQESQISTSTAVRNAGESSKESNDKYSCNMCGESFSREKKLLAHIQSHYSKMDEEDRIRAEKTPKRKTRK